MESIINTYNNQMIETYAEMFPDIDASIISDLVKNNDDPMTVEAYLIELNNSIGKTERERRIDLEANLGQEIVSELKFSSLGTNHEKLDTELKSIKKTSKWSRFRKLLKGSKNTISNQDDVKFQKFD
jgi:hypothetical protein